ncbi:MAG: alpha/beta fold hydrolase [Rhodopseudomonas sp.]|nr:alpha/beta fold hydrolase [Rhodopseudomonas sp.]
MQADKDAPRIALVHSLAMDHRFWLPVAERLADTASVLIYDCRGHGASDKPSGPYTATLFGRDLADLMDHVGWPSAAVAGASMGGCVALAFGADFVQRTNGLGLIDTTAWYGPDAPAAWAGRAEKALAEGLKGLIEFQVTRWFGDKFRADNPEVVQQCVDIFLANDLPAYAETCRMLGTTDLRGLLSRIACPTTVVVGEEDYAATPAMAKVMHDGIKNSRMIVIEKARHLIPLEVPDRIAAELKHLLKQSM